MTKLKAGERTKREILEAGVKLWIPSNGQINAHSIGASIGLTHSAILYHFGTINELRNAVAEHAVSVGNSRIIMHLVSMRHAAISSMSAEDRKRHVSAAQS
jgi:AcrR family transcriptional regulator